MKSRSAKKTELIHISFGNNFGSTKITWPVSAIATRSAGVKSRNEERQMNSLLLCLLKLKYLL